MQTIPIIVNSKAVIAGSTRNPSQHAAMDAGSSPA